MKKKTSQRKMPPKNWILPGHGLPSLEELERLSLPAVAPVVQCDLFGEPAGDVLTTRRKSPDRTRRTKRGMTDEPCGSRHGL